MNNNRTYQLKRKMSIVLTIFLSIIIAALEARAQNADSLIQVINRGPYTSINDAKGKIPIHLQKVDMKMLEVGRQMRAQGITQSKAASQHVGRTFSTSLVEVSDQASFHAEVYLKQFDDAAVAKLVTLGIIVEYTNENFKQITCWVPFNTIETLAKDDNVVNVCNVGKPHVNVGAYTTAGDRILQSAGARSTYNIDGTGIKVGAISDGAEDWTLSKNSGDLPASFQDLRDRKRGWFPADPAHKFNEGTAMSEIVHDIAPGASLAFADDGSSEADFNAGIDALVSAGCSVIVDDVTYYDERMFEDGPIAQHVDQVTGNGIKYVSSAGNEGTCTWDGQSTDVNGNSWMEFSGSDETNSITVQPQEQLTVVLEWDDQYGKSYNDYDLYLFAGSDPSSQVLAPSTNRQNGSGNPYEIIQWTNPSYTSSQTVYLRVKLYSVISAREVKMVAFASGSLSYTTEAGIFGHAAANSCISVAAINSSDGQTIENFSSHGPSRIYTFDSNGNPVSHTDRPTPTICGIDGVQTYIGTTYGLWYPGYQLFYGTSAAAPHVAGIAALQLQRNGNLTWQQVEENLIQSTTKVSGMNGQNFTNTYGYGRINAYGTTTYLYVPQAFSTVQSAVNAAAHNQTVYISSGTFNENVTATNKSNLTVTGAGVNTTTISGTLTFNNCSNLQLWSTFWCWGENLYYINLGNFDSYVAGTSSTTGIALYSCTGFDQSGIVNYCSTGLFASGSSGLVQDGADFISNNTSVAASTGANVQVGDGQGIGPQFCTSVTYDFSAGPHGSINAYQCYYKNGSPRVLYLRWRYSWNIRA